MQHRRFKPAFESVAAPVQGRRMEFAPGVWCDPKGAQSSVDAASLVVALESAKPAGERTSGRLAEMTWKFAYADTVGVNRKLYPYSVVKEAVDLCDARAKAGQVYGRVDHPAEWDHNALRSTMADASHRITGCAFEGDKKTLVVTAAVLDNQFGKQLMSCFESGGNPGLSQRAGAIFERASEDQKLAYKQQISDPLDVAVVLRLVTFDVVSSPGFPDAADPVVMEQATEEGATMTLEQLKQQFPNTFAEAVNVGKAEGQRMAVTAALEAERPKIISDATKPLNDQIAALTTANGELKAAFEHIKPVMVKHGVVNEKITDSEAARQVGALTVELTQVKSELGTVKTSFESIRTERDALLANQGRQAIESKVRTTYKDSKFVDDIVTYACESAKTEAEALERASRKNAEILKYAGGSPGRTTQGGHLPGGDPAPEAPKTQAAGRAIFAAG